MQAQASLEIRAYMSEIGRRGAAVHQLTQEARMLGVFVRREKRIFIAKGYDPEIALSKARGVLMLRRKK